MRRAGCSVSIKTFLEPLYHTDWHVYAKPPFAGPQQVLAYLARYTHRVAISNSRTGFELTIQLLRKTGMLQ
jgi:hypothetical protein